VEWQPAGAIGRVISFGEDANRALYAITASNKIYRIVRQ
jgi:hypothetical protein